MKAVLDATVHTAQTHSRKREEKLLWTLHNVVNNTIEILGKTGILVLD